MKLKKINTIILSACFLMLTLAGCKGFSPELDFFEKDVKSTIYCDGVLFEWPSVAASYTVNGTKTTETKIFIPTTTELGSACRVDITPEGSTRQVSVSKYADGLDKVGMLVFSSSKTVMFTNRNFYYPESVTYYVYPSSTDRDADTNPVIISTTGDETALPSVGLSSDGTRYYGKVVYVHDDLQLKYDILSYEYLPATDSVPVEITSVVTASKSVIINFEPKDIGSTTEAKYVVKYRKTNDTSAYPDNYLTVDYSPELSSITVSGLSTKTEYQFMLSVFIRWQYLADYGSVKSVTTLAPLTAPTNVTISEDRTTHAASRTEYTDLIVTFEPASNEGNIKYGLEYSFAGCDTWVSVTSEPTINTFTEEINGGNKTFVRVYVYDEAFPEDKFYSENVNKQMEAVPVSDLFPTSAFPISNSSSSSLNWSTVSLPANTPFGSKFFAFADASAYNSLLFSNYDSNIYLPSAGTFAKANAYFVTPNGIIIKSMKVLQKLPSESGITKNAVGKYRNELTPDLIFNNKWYLEVFTTEDLTTQKILGFTKYNFY